MHRFGGGSVFFWCPRCGTLKLGDAGIGYETPKLVERCRQYQAGMTTDVVPGHLQQWRIIGIAESINVPSERGNFA
jgi:hypothetical protein